MPESSLYKKLFLVLQEISYAVVNSDKITSIANALLEVAINFTTAEAGSLMLLNERNELFILSSRGLPPEYVKDYRGRIGEGIAGIVAKNRRPVLVQDINRHEEFRDAQRDHYKTRSFISCPVVYRERLLGVININDKSDGRPFTSDELGLLQIIANHAAIALENTSLLNRLKSSATQLEQMNRRLMESDLLKTEFLTRISHELRTPLNALNGAIYYLQQREKVPAAERREFLDIIRAESGKLTSTVENLITYLQFGDEARVVDKTVIGVDDILRDLASSPALKSSLNARGVRLAVNTALPPLPVVGDRIRTGQLFANLLEGFSHHLEAGDVIGIAVRESDFVIVEIALPREMPKAVLQHLISAKGVFHRTPSEDTLKLYLAGNIAHAHRWRLESCNEAGTCRITLFIPRNSSEAQRALVNRSIDAFVQHVSDALGIDICSVMMSDDLTGELQVTSAHGLDDDIVRRTHIKIGDEIAGWVALEGKPLFIEDVENDPRFAKKNVPQYHTKSLMSFPLKIDDRVVGVLNLNNKKSSESFTREDYRIALALSDRMSGYLKHVSREQFQDDAFQQFLSSIDSLIRSASNQPDEQERRKAS